MVGYTYYIYIFHMAREANTSPKQAKGKAIDPHSLILPFPLLKSN